MRCARILSLALLGGCSLFGPSKESHPRDVETSTAPPTSAGACEGDDAPTLTPATFFAGAYRPSATRPPPGTLVALEGTPEAHLVCTQRGCEFECCENACAADAECPYVLRDESDEQRGEVCLAHSSFACGGSDCSPFCEPFSHAPKQRYRFVGRVEYREQSLGKTPILRLERFCLSR